MQKHFSQDLPLLELLENNEIDPNNPLPGVVSKRPLLHVLLDEDDQEEAIYYLLFDNKIKAAPNLVDEATSLTPLCAAV